MEINLGIEVEPLKINVDDVEVLRAELVRHARELSKWVRILHRRLSCHPRPSCPLKQLPFQTDRLHLLLAFSPFRM